MRRHQLPGETLDTWLIDLRSLVKSCGYTAGAGVETVLRDQLVLGVADPLIREKLLYENDLQLAKACDIVRACEASKAQLNLINTPLVTESAHSVRNFDRKPNSQPGYRQPSSTQQPTSAAPSPFQPQPPSDAQQERCNKCNRRYKKNQCRVGNVRCHGCGVLGHVVSCCPNPHRQRPPPTAQQLPHAPPGRVYALDGEYQWVGDVERGDTAIALPRSVEDDYFVNHALRSSSSGAESYQQLSLDGVDIKFKLDSGATCNILPLEFFNRMPKQRQRLHPGPIVRSYGAKDGPLKVLGLYATKLSHLGATFVVDFVVVDEPGQPPILGLPSCDKLNLIRRVDVIHSPAATPPIVTEFKDVFTGLGKLPIEHDIKLLSGANRVEPVVCAAGRLPFRLEDRVFKKLNEMVADGIITPVQEPTDWVSRMMVIGKPDGDVRICLDPSE